MKFAQLGYDYRRQLENWITWTRRDLGQPVGFKSIMSSLFKSGRSGEGDDTAPLDAIINVCDLDALDFDHLIKTLSPIQIEIFKIQHLDRIKVGNGRFRFVPRHLMNRKYRLLEMSRSTYERRLVEIETSIKRRGGL